MKQQVEVITQAVNKANLAGVYNLQESAIIAQAVGQLQAAVNPPEPEAPNMEACPVPKAKGKK